MSNNSDGFRSQFISTKDSRITKFLKANALLFLTIFGAIFGIIAGLCLRSMEFNSKIILLVSYPGELFMRILKLLILPLIIASLISGSASLNAKMNGKIAIRTFVIFLATSMFNAFLGICVVTMVHPGSLQNMNASDTSLTEKKMTDIMDNVLDVGRNIIPDNIFEATFQQTYTAYEQDIQNTTWNSSAFLSTDNFKRVLKQRSGINTLGLAIFCLIFGTVLGTLGSKGKTVMEFFCVVFEVVMKIMSFVIWMTPIGVASIIAGKILSSDDIGLLVSQLGWFILTICIGVFFYQLIVLQVLYLMFVGKNPYKYYCGLFQGTLTACATASTAAALPVTFRCMIEKLHVDPRVCRFVLPIGCNINMDGTALFIAVSTVFIAQMNGMVLGLGDYCTVFLTATLASMSSASVPSAALVLLMVSLAAINAPTDNVSLLFAIDWLVDRIRTSNNMLGDCYTTAIVEQLSKHELGQLDASGDDKNHFLLSKEVDEVDILLNHQDPELGSRIESKT